MVNPARPFAEVMMADLGETHHDADKAPAIDVPPWEIEITDATRPRAGALTSWVWLRCEGRSLCTTLPIADVHARSRLAAELTARVLTARGPLKVDPTTIRTQQADLEHQICTIIDDRCSGIIQQAADTVRGASRHDRERPKPRPVHKLYGVGWPLRGLSVLFGREGTCKSTLAMSLGVDLARAGKRVYYLDIENSDMDDADDLLWNVSLGVGLKRPPETLFMPEGFMISLAECAWALKAEIERLKIDFLIVDSGTNACEGDPNDALAARDYYHHIRMLDAPACLTIAHTGKTGDGGSVLGSVVWQAIPRKVVRLTPGWRKARGEGVPLMSAVDTLNQVTLDVMKANTNRALDAYRVEVNRANTDKRGVRVTYRGPSPSEAEAREAAKSDEEAKKAAGKRREEQEKKLNAVAAAMSAIRDADGLTGTRVMAAMEGLSPNKRQMVRDEIARRRDVRVVDGPRNSRLFHYVDNDGD